MSVDFYGCDCCKESVYEEYVERCNKCGSSLCTSCLVNNDIKSKYAHSYGYVFDPSNPDLMLKYVQEGFSLYNDSGDQYYEDGDIIDDSGIDSKYCPFCSGEEINKELLFDHIIEKYKIDIKEEWKILKQTK